MFVSRSQTWPARQSVFTAHWTHESVAALQIGVGFAQSLFWAQPTHVLAAVSHTGVMPLQSELSAHSTQAPVPTLQLGVPPLQSASVMHPVHPIATSQFGAPAPQAWHVGPQAAVVLQVEQPVASQMIGSLPSCVSVVPPLGER
jgi:hypothetical protein